MCTQIQHHLNMGRQGLLLENQPTQFSGRFEERRFVGIMFARQCFLSVPAAACSELDIFSLLSLP